MSAQGLVMLPESHSLDGCDRSGLTPGSEFRSICWYPGCLVCYAAALQMGYRRLEKHLGVAREVLHHRSRSQSQDGTHSTYPGIITSWSTAWNRSLPSLRINADFQKKQKTVLTLTAFHIDVTHLWNTKRFKCSVLCNYCEWRLELSKRIEKHHKNCHKNCRHSHMF